MEEAWQMRPAAEVPLQAQTTYLGCARGMAGLEALLSS